MYDLFVIGESFFAFLVFVLWETLQPDEHICYSCGGSVYYPHIFSTKKNASCTNSATIKARMQPRYLRNNTSYIYFMNV